MGNSIGSSAKDGVGSGITGARDTYGSGTGKYGDFEGNFGFTFGGYSLTLSGVRYSHSHADSKIKKSFYSGIIVENENDFDRTCYLADILEDNEFEVEYVYSQFKPKVQKEYEKMAKKKGYDIEVHHPMFRISDGTKAIYFDWLVSGFSIRQIPKFEEYRSEYLGYYSLKSLLNACIDSSSEIFNLKKNNCMHWGQKVRNAL